MMQVTRTEPDIGREVKYIVARAAAGETRVVGLGPLILFSTATGDAWLLDWHDTRALCLARAGAQERVNITETTSQFFIEWNCSYAIHGDIMTFHQDSGRTVSVQGYPTAAIMETTRRLREASGGAG